MLCTHIPYYEFNSCESMAKSSTANVVLAKSISPLMFSPATEGKREHQERRQQMEASPNNLEVCTICNSTAILFDVETSETVCSLLRDGSHCSGRVIRRSMESIFRRRYREQER